MLRRTRTRDIRRREKVRLRVRPVWGDLNADRSRSQPLYPPVLRQGSRSLSSPGLVQRMLDAGKGLLSRVRRVRT
jgi:hypothetical protein